VGEPEQAAAAGCGGEVAPALVEGGACGADGAVGVGGGTGGEVGQDLAGGGVDGLEGGVGLCLDPPATDEQPAGQPVDEGDLGTVWPGVDRHCVLLYRFTWVRYGARGPAGIPTLRPD